MKPARGATLLALSLFAGAFVQRVEGCRSHRSRPARGSGRSHPSGPRRRLHRRLLRALSTRFPVATAGRSQVIP